MKPFSNLNFSYDSPMSLVWKQPKFREDYYELGDEPASDALYATISWPKWLSDLAVACSADGTWHFDRLGWMRRTIMATRLVEPCTNSDSQHPPASIQAAKFEVGWFWEGDIVLSNGEVYHWFCTNAFRNAWVLSKVVSDNHANHLEINAQVGSTKIKRTRKGFHLGKQSKPVRKERVVYEIKFGMHWFKQEAWITLPISREANHPGMLFLLCLGMYLGYCYNQDNAAAVAVCTTAAVS